MATTYLATATWESYALGERQAATTTRTLHVTLRPTAPGLVLTITATPPTYSATTAPPLVEVAQHLAALYARVELLLTPAGEIAALLNYPALCQTGEHLLAGLQAAAVPGDQVTATLLAFAGRQLASPAAFLSSLQFDYLYHALLAGLPSSSATAATARPARQFAGFFDKTPLWFTEQATLVEQAGGNRRLRLHGPLDEQRTDLAAVRVRQAQAAQLAAPGRAPVLPAPHFCYEATYSLGPAAALPFGLDLTVYARAGQLLNKEYHLRLECV